MDILIQMVILAEPLLSKYLSKAILNYPLTACLNNLKSTRFAYGNMIYLILH